MKKIALVDDDQFIQDFISQKLMQGGYEVVLCGDGAEALNFLETEKPDLILLDIDLPNRDGFEILLELKKHAELQSTPVVMFSNNDNPDLQTKTIEAGAADFYFKATTQPAELLDKITPLLTA